MTVTPNKRPKKSGTIYQRKDGMWCAAIELTPIPGGASRRRKVLSTAGMLPNGKPKPEKQIRAELDAQIFKLRSQKERDGDIVTGGMTLDKWLHVWFETIALKKLKPRSAAGYRSSLKYIRDSIGKVRLDKLTPTHVTRMHDYVTIEKKLSSTTALNAHAALSVALKYAERQGLVRKNVAKLTDAPRRARNNAPVLTAEEGVKTLYTVSGDRLGSRWAAAFFTGARQGELLGLELDRVTDQLDLSWQLQRISWEHGCSSKCGRKRGTDCPARKVTMPADWEYRRLDGGLLLSRPKSHAGWRIIPLVDPLKSILERRIAIAATEPNPHGLVWTADRKKSQGGHHELLPLDGSPIDPSRDNKAWHGILERAGVTDVPLHGARHTTASLLLKANVAEPLIMKILGHSTYVVTRGYQNVDREQLDKAMTAMSALMPLEGYQPDSSV